MYPSRGKGFTEKLCSSPSFRGKFGGLYASVTSALLRLGATGLPVPTFIQDKIARAKAALADEERLLDIMRKEADAREVGSDSSAPRWRRRRRRTGGTWLALRPSYLPSPSGQQRSGPGERPLFPDRLLPGPRRGRGPAVVLRFPEDNVQPWAGRILRRGRAV